MDSYMSKEDREKFATRMDAIFRGAEGYYVKDDPCRSFHERMSGIQHLMADDVFGGLGDETVANLVWLAIGNAFRLGKEDAAESILKGVQSGVYWTSLHCTKMSYESNMVLEREDESKEGN